MIIRSLTKWETVGRAAKLVLTHLLFAGLTVLAAYLGWIALELRTQLRIENAESDVRIQVLQSEVEHLKAMEFKAGQDVIKSQQAAQAAVSKNTLR